MTVSRLVLIQFRSHFRERQGVGKLYDISYAGCKAESGTRPAIGASVTLRFRIAKAEQAIVIQAGAVAWAVPKKYFGVRFVSLQRELMVAMLTITDP